MRINYIIFTSFFYDSLFIFLKNIHNTILKFVLKRFIHILKLFFFVHAENNRFITYLCYFFPFIEAAYWYNLYEKRSSLFFLMCYFC